MSFLKASSAVPKISAPSPTPSNSSSGGAKRKRPAEDVAPATIYSQPQETGTGNHIFTQLTYAVEHLRNTDKWETFQEITDYLNVPKDDAHTRSQLLILFRSPESRLEWDSKKDLYRYKPKYSIRNAAELKGYLQNQKSAQGLAVRDLKDGWPKVTEAIDQLAAKKELLVQRVKKEDQAKTVWINDPSLMHYMDPEFCNKWHAMPLPPNPDDLRNKLLAAGLKPSSAPREIVTAKPKEKKKKAPRRGGKQTNTHMASILKDYSHKRK